MAPCLCKLTPKKIEQRLNNAIAIDAAQLGCGALQELKSQIN